MSHLPRRGRAVGMNVADVDRADGGLRPVVWGPVVWATGFSIGLKFSLALLFAASFLLMTVRAQDPDTVDVRINAQRQADDRIEFALQTKKDGEGAGSWNDRILPRGRFFPSDPTVGRWLASTMVTIGDASDSVEQMESSAGLTIRIAARRIANGRTEFAIQQLHQDGSWGERQLPSGRFLPADAPLGRWLSSTPLQLTSGSSAPSQAATTLPQPQPEPQATVSNDSTPSCTPESVAAEVSASIAQVCSSTGCGTAFSIGDGEWITAEHVVEGAKRVSLKNADFSVIAGVHGLSTDLDLALLTTERNWPSLRWGMPPILGATTFVVGYGLGHQTLSPGLTRGVVSELIQRADQAYIRTDAAANPGNSGGPLLDYCGNVIGVVQRKLAGLAIDNVAFALDAVTIREALPSLRAPGIWRLTDNEGRDSSPAWSPDSRRIVYVSSPRGDTLNTDIYIANADDSNITRLTASDAWAYNPTWSPDGDRIAFNSTALDTSGFITNIYVMNSDGSAVTQLTNSEWTSSPIWSPDGERIAFSSESCGDHASLFQGNGDRPSLFPGFGDGVYSRHVICVMNSDGSGATPITNIGEQLQNAMMDEIDIAQQDLAWSPDGVHIAFTSRICRGRLNDREQICLANSDGSGVAQITSNVDNIIPFRLAWSPDGQRIAFGARPFTGNYFGPLHIYLMDRDGSSVTRLTDDDATYGSPSWSPDGRHIAFSSNRGAYGKGNIHVMNNDGTEITRLTDHRFWVFAPTWSPDGRRIAFVAEANGDRDIFVANAPVYPDNGQ